MRDTLKNRFMSTGFPFGFRFTSAWLTSAWLTSAWLTSAWLTSAWLTSAWFASAWFVSTTALAQTERLGGAGPLAESLSKKKLPPADIEAVFKEYSQKNPVTQVPKDPAAQVAAARKIPIYRKYHSKVGDHFLTLTEAEGSDLGYVNEFKYQIFADSSVEGTIPLYRCLSRSRALPIGDRYVSEFQNCQNDTNVVSEGLLGYAAKTKLQGTKALYLCFNGVDYFMTLWQSECTPSGTGFSVVRILGYIP